MTIIDFQEQISRISTVLFGLMNAKKKLQAKLQTILLGSKLESTRCKDERMIRNLGS